MSDSEELQKAKTAYQAAVDLWKLASDQIYNRFSAMLTANSIIVAIIGVIITSSVKIPFELPRWLISMGLALCVIWWFFLAHGIKVENHYRRKAEEFEKNVIPTGKTVVIPLSDKSYKGFGLFSYFTIVVFAFIYIALLLLLICGPKL